jgi:hypothetical protein
MRPGYRRVGVELKREELFAFGLEKALSDGSTWGFLNVSDTPELVGPMCKRR